MNDTLDFSVLDALMGNLPNTKKQPENLTQGVRDEGREYKDIPVGDDALKSHSAVAQGIYSRLEAERREKERRSTNADRQAEVYFAYQEAIKRGGALMSEIMKGITAGEDPARLLLKACELIGSMTGDGLFYEQARQSLIAIHGAGLLQPVPLTIELEVVKNRLAMLTRPELDDEPEDSRMRIGQAIKAHEERMSVLMARIGTDIS